ncbi:hypothetical protein U1Q18_027036 [Sarracenia purpurea var. burkii]
MNGEVEQGRCVGEDDDGVVVLDAGGRREHSRARIGRRRRLSRHQSRRRDSTCDNLNVRPLCKACFALFIGDYWRGSLD